MNMSEFDIPPRPRTLKPPKLPELSTGLELRYIRTELDPKIKEQTEKMRAIVLTPPKIEFKKPEKLELRYIRTELDPTIKSLADRILKKIYLINP